MPVFFITADQIEQGAVTITGPLADHLRTSLRLQPGEEIWLGDEHRRRYLIKTTRIDRKALQGRILEERTGPPPTGPAITVGQTLLKGDRMDWVIQKATELGASSLVPLVTQQTVVRPRVGRLDHQRERWQRIALEAAQQSERWDIPTVTVPQDTVGFFKEQPAVALKLILCERTAGKNLSEIELSPGQGPGRIIVAVGPEGGWTKEEVSLAIDAGFAPITLGSRILRSETATLAVLSVLQSRLGELGSAGA